MIYFCALRHTSDYEKKILKVFTDFFLIKKVYLSYKSWKTAGLLQNVFHWSSSVRCSGNRNVFVGLAKNIIFFRTENVLIFAYLVKNFHLNRTIFCKESIEKYLNAVKLMQKKTLFTI